MPLKNLKHRISFLNLLNGLHLTQEQLEKLIKINKKYKELKDEYTEKFDKLVEAEKKVLTDLEKVVRQNKPIPKKLKDKVHTVENHTREAKKLIDKTNVEFIKSTEEVFTREQMEVIKEFKPCTIPPKNLSDPVRVGQASDNERVINMMRRIRQMPKHMLEANMDRLVDRHMHHLTDRKRLSEEEEAQERARIRDFLMRIHEMEEVQFEMCKDRLAEQYKWKDKADDLKKELDDISKIRHPKPKQSKASNYFLDPEIVPVLEERLEKAKSGEGKLRGRKGSKSRKRK
jgi:hypothetical protein